MATDVGAIRARMELDSRNFNQGITKARTDMQKTAEEVRRTSKQFRDLSQTLSGVGLNAREIRKIQTEIRSANPEILEKQLKLVESQLRRVGASSAQIEAIKNRLRDTSDEAQRTSRSFGDVEQALTAIGGSMALSGLLRTVVSLTDEANKLAMAVTGTSEVAKAFGEDLDKVNEAAAELSDPSQGGFMNLTEAYGALKTALTMFNLEDSVKLIRSVGDAAAYNRESHLGWGEAVVNVLQGIKMGNSELTENAGITTNLSVMYERYAATLGKSATDLTDAEKYQAAFNGMLQEGALFAGNASKAMEGYTGTQTAFRNSVQTTRTELGEAYLPVIEEITQELTPLIVNFSKWVAENKEVVVGITGGTAAVLTLVTAMTTLSTVIAVVNVAMKALQISMGPVGWAIAIIGTIAAGVVSYAASANLAANALSDFEERQRRLNETLNASPLTRQAEEVQNLQTEIETLNGLLEKRTEIQQQMAAIGKPTYGDIEASIDLGKLAEDLQEIDKELEEVYNIKNPDELPNAIKRLKEELESSVPAMLELKEAEIGKAVADADHVKQLTHMRDRYKELTAQQKLNAAEQMELNSIVQRLKQEYPGLHVLMDDENRLRIMNIELADESIKAEQDLFNKKTELLRSELQAMRDATAEKLKLIKAQITANIALLASAQSANDPDLFLAEKLTKSGYSNKLAEAQVLLQTSLNQLDKDLAALDTGNLDIFRFTRPTFEVPTTDTGGGSGGKGAGTGKNPAPKSPEEVAREMYSQSVRWIQHMTAMGKMSADQEIAAYERLATRYFKYTELRWDAEEKVADLRKRKTDEAERVESESLRAREREQQEFVDRQLRLMDELKRETLNNIRDMRQSELDALDDRRREIERFYDEQIREIDDAERADERKSIIADIEKYRHSTSREGQEKLKELQERLRKMDYDDQRRNLQDQKDAELRNLNERRRTIERYYDDIEKAFEGSALDIMGIESKLQDDRLKELTTTHGLMEEELKRFVAEWIRIYNSIPSVTAPGTIGGPGPVIDGGSIPDPGEISDPGMLGNPIDQMKSNSEAWKTASAAERQRLADANKALGESMGWTRKADGAWYDSSGNRIYHTGGIFGERHFRYADRLMPDEIAAIVQQGEVGLQPAQIASLLDSGSGQRPAVVNNYNAPLIAHDGDVRLEDDADVRMYWSERQLAAQRLLAGGDR